MKERILRVREAFNLNRAHFAEIQAFNVCGSCLHSHRVHCLAWQGFALDARTWCSYLVLILGASCVALRTTRAIRVQFHIFMPFMPFCFVFHTQQSCGEMLRRAMEVRGAYIGGISISLMILQLMTLVFNTCLYSNLNSEFQALLLRD